MAGLKKTKKEKSTSPNVVLVIFLVFFVLVSIGLGIWGYYGYAGQEDLRKAASGAKAAEKGERLGKEFYAMQYRYIRTALGDTLDEKESGQMNVDLDDFNKENGGKFTAEADKEAARIFIGKLKKDLLTPDDARDFKTTYQKELKTFQDKAKEWEGKTAAALAKVEQMESIAKRLTAKQDAFHQEASDRIAKDSAAQLAIVKLNSDTFKKTNENNQDLIKQLQDKDAELGKKDEEHAQLIKVKERMIAVLKEQAKAADGGGGNPANVGRVAGDFQPLMLDWGLGKPLWDQPVGKIIRVDLENRQVVINVGSSHGAKPDLTFNFFGANSSGRAEGKLKGGLEIVKVLDTSSSVARISFLAYYDSEGREIPLTAQSLARIQRDRDDVLPREGDLLFNLFWGARVAIAGYVNVTGDTSENPAEQNRQMQDFIHLLQRNGMQVDAYVDLRDGQIKGQVSSKTRYLIRGDDLRTGEAKAPAGKMADDDKEKDKDKDKEKEKEPAKDGGAINAERNDAINKSSRTLFNDARDKGLLLISAENFAGMIGYRRLRGANSAEVSIFRPVLPFAGSGEGGVRNIQERPKEEEKKAADPEKKDGADSRANPGFFGSLLKEASGISQARIDSVAEPS